MDRLAGHYIYGPLSFLLSLFVCCRSFQPSCFETSPPTTEGKTGSAVDQTCGLQPQFDLVRSLLVEPSVHDYWFRETSVEALQAGFGQSVQSVVVDFLLNGTTHLFAVEAGAHDGEFQSNTLYLETNRSWDILLVEANPDLQEEVLLRSRKAFLLRGGLSISNSTGVFKFLKRGAAGGIVDVMSPASEQSWRTHMREAQMLRRLPGRAAWWNATGRHHRRGRGGMVDVLCFPLHYVMKVLGRRVIDYWSLDTEGSETDILQHTDFSWLEVGVLTVEHFNEEDRLRSIVEIMTLRGFQAIASIWLDAYFVNPAYFERRGLTVPTCSTVQEALARNGLQREVDCLQRFPQPYQ